MNIKDNHLTLTSKVIIEAVSGDPIAMNCVLNHYQGYIVNLSLRKDYTEFAKSPFYVDEYTRRRLETKLMEKIMTFNITR
ncbi:MULTISPECIES: helix-turn-helix domain-containing protein [Enterococcus]|uniref:helix-turn-helix domain-containing protein n=1 Tax=Enterococcus TaxID=1350 RepID=UPI0015972E79|nr:helix-turn-helix domain-containing protein [Enterococcus devriesei]MBU5366742.1 helix-turn-helix domain-containing protein [Enterococcus devriesei]BBM18396.1 hypothetical protein G15_2061 [Enterococcus avium]